MMDPGLIGLLGVAGMLALILLGGMSPGLAMLLAGFCGMAALNPPATFAALHQLGVAGCLAPVALDALAGLAQRHGLEFILSDEVFAHAGGLVLWATGRLL